MRNIVLLCARSINIIRSRITYRKITGKLKKTLALRPLTHHITKILPNTLLHIIPKAKPYYTKASLHFIVG